MSIITTSVNATLPVGSDSTGGANGLLNSFHLVKQKINDIVTDLTTLSAGLEAIPDLPSSGATGLAILNSATPAAAYAAIDFGTVLQAWAAFNTLDQIYTYLGTSHAEDADKGVIHLGQNGLKINWFNVSVSGDTVLTYKEAYTTRVFCAVSSSNFHPGDGSWGGNTSSRIILSSLSQCTIGITRGGLYSVITIGV